MKKIYILSDAHLGSWAIEHRRTHERRLVSFLDKVKKDAMAVYPQAMRYYIFQGV